jgi:hypothetical protein
MFSSENKNVGFSAIGQEELEKVNGGDLPTIIPVLIPIFLIVTKNK